MNDNVIELTASALPVKTWNWLRVNDTKIKMPSHLNEKEFIQIGKLPEGISYKVFNSAEYDQNNVFDHISGAIGSEYQKWLMNQQVKIYDFIIDNQLIHSDQALEESNVISIQFELENEASSAAVFIFHVRQAGNANIVLESRSSKNGEGFAAVSMLCDLEKDAKLTIHQVQMLGQNYQYISDIGAVQATDSKLDIVRVNLGGSNSYLGAKTSLEDKNAEFNSRLAYLSRNTQKLDVNDIVLHKGKKTLSDINSEGVLLDQAEKTYKGTIDLQHGCAGAKGQELETVLLLSDDVINKTVPLILCGEEDVEGNHGASIGKIDEESLLYMESRGIPEEQARLLIVNGRLDQIIKKISDQALVEKASTFIKEVFTDESKLS